MRLRPHLTIAAVLVLGGLASGARAEELSLDAKLLDPAVAGQAKAKKGKQQTAVNPASGPKADKGKAENRQFGELEGWSPGKSPPKKKEEERQTSSGGRAAPVSMTPSGNMSVGMPF